MFRFSRLSLLLVLPSIALWSTPRPQTYSRKSPKEGSAIVTVTAEASSVEVAKTPNPVLVVGQEAIQNQEAREVADLLQHYLPGQVNTYGSPGMSSTLCLGGASGSHTVVMVDGIRFKDASNSFGPDFSAFGLAGIDQIEVLQGTASTLYGSDAHGGVVSLLSVQPSEKGLQSWTSLRAGNQGMARATIKASYSADKAWVSTGLDLAQEHLAVAVDQPYRKANGHLGAGLHVGEDGLLQVNYRHSFSGAPFPYDWDYTGSSIKRVFLADDNNTSRLEIFQVGYRHTIGSDLLLNANAGQCDTLRFFKNKGANNLYEGKTRQALLSATYMPDALAFTALVDLGSEDMNTPDFMASGNVRFAAKGRFFALAAESTWELNQQFRLVGSLRQQWESTTAQNQTAQVQDVSNQALVWKLGVNWLFSKGFRAYASTGTAFNTPSPYQILMNHTHSGPRLSQSEKSHAHFLGADWQGTHAFAKVEWHTTRFTDRIRYVAIGGNNGFYDYVPSLRVEGLEFNGGYKTDTWSTEAFIRFREGRDYSKASSEAQFQFGSADMPFCTYGVKGSLAWKRWQLDASLWRMGHRYVLYYNDMQSNNPVLPYKHHFTDASCAITWKKTEKLTFIVRGEHLFQNPTHRAAWLAGSDIDKNEVALVPGYLAQTRIFSLAVSFRTGGKGKKQE